MRRASIFTLVCAAHLLAQGPSRESYRPIKLEKITSYPEVPVYVYELAGGQFCTMNTRLDAKEGSEIKIASDPHDWYVMDIDGKTYKCKYVAFGDGGVRAPEPKNK